MKKILFYSQHVLGMGHLVRAMEIARGLRNFRVAFLNGGETVSGFATPPDIEVVNLPAVKPDPDLKYIEASDPSRSLHELKVARARVLLEQFERLQPDALIVELFPFGRRQFVFELLPLLARIGRRGHRRCPTKVVCSLRDILVRQTDLAHHEEWVCTLLNRYFDLVLVHSDPTFQELEETFSRVKDIKSEIRYTGYVAQADDGGTAEPDETDSAPQAGEATIVVSIGGGRVGYELLDCAVRASALVAATQPHRMLVFTGPFLPEERFAQLQALAASYPSVTVRRYTGRFLSYLNAADLSISMAGYNTCMNVLTTGCRALVLPFAPAANEEQTIRAQKLEGLGVVDVIRPEELHPAALADKILDSLSREPSPHLLDIYGVEHTAAAISELLDDRRAAAAVLRSRPEASEADLGPAAHVAALRAELDRRHAENAPVDVFLRDDDVGEDERGLRALLNLALSRSIAVNLEVIPGVLTDSTTGLLDRYKHFCPTLLEMNQHGYRHENHEPHGKKYEFGTSRSFDQQLEDIETGRETMEQVFREKFHPVFTPPWNRCTETTFKVLDELGFPILSRSRTHSDRNGHRFREIPVTLDLFRWNGRATLRPGDELLPRLVDQIRAGTPIGILLHHHVMEANAFSFLEALLDVLTDYPVVRFHTFRSLVGALV